MTGGPWLKWGIRGAVGHEVTLGGVVSESCDKRHAKKLPQGCNLFAV